MLLTNLRVNCITRDGIIKIERRGTREYREKGNDDDKMVRNNSRQKSGSVAIIFNEVLQVIFLEGSLSVSIGCLQTLIRGLGTNLGL